MPNDLHLIGNIVRLQVQTGHLKQGEKPRRWYDPAPITDVATMRLEDGGVVGIGADGTIHHDVHHRDHPISRFRGENGVSVGFTSHYTAMRERFSSHLSDGIAGENILVACEDIQTTNSLGSVLIIENDGGRVVIDDVMVAAPCVEFTKYCLQRPRDEKPDRSVTEALQFLDNGMRGFYATPVPDSSTTDLIRVGDPVYRHRG